MNVTLINDKLTAVISSFGAELVSVKDNEGREFMWQADPKVWKRHSPVLFPIVGKVKNDSFKVDGKAYHMTQHGIARDMEFETVEKSDTKAVFVLRSSAVTKEKYPYDFSLTISYVLENNSVTVNWKVENTDTREISFSIGAHPAFIGRGDSLSDGTVNFETESDSLEYGILSDDGYMTDSKSVLNLEKGNVGLTKDFFDNDALVFEHSDCKAVSIFENGGRIVRLSFEAPLFAIWSAKGAGVPFVCIEPWYGRVDNVNYCGSFDNREYANRLPVSGVFEKSYLMEFSE